MPYLEQRLLLQQKLSPQQVLFSTLLQLPMMALEQKIKTELEINPLLEEDMEADMELEEPKEKDETQEDAQESETAEETAEDEDADIDWDELVNDDSSYEHIPKDTNKEEVVWPDPAPISLSEHLITQLNYHNLTTEDRAIGEYIIWNINEDGYLSISIDLISENLGFPEERILKVLKLIQALEPSGIAARDLRECILIQLRENKENNAFAIKIIEDYFDDFKNKRFEKLAKQLECTLEEIRGAIEIISRINPKPGEGYIKPNENYIIPDLIVEKVGGEYIVSLNDWNIPRLRINNAYRRMLTTKKGVSDDAQKYIRQKIESARWVINSIQQRKVTILRVMKEIVLRQRAFFDKGKGHIKPMILKDIADAIDMDISTISRVTNGKYVQTDQGVFELKYFFSEKMTTADGEQVSTLNIKDQIKEIIENEDPRSPLPDDKIVKILLDKKLPIARRTVAKYREQLRIPVARLRRKI